MRRSRLSLFVVPLLLALLKADTSPPAQDREFEFPVLAVQTALRQMGVYRGARLPTLDGFITMSKAQMPHYERPYYEYKIELESKSANKTVVHVKASISAWCQDPEGGQSSYQAFASNGRLESDLLDRLEGYLTNHKSDLVTEPEIVQRRIAEVRRQEAQAQQRIAELEKQLQALQTSRSQPDSTEFVSVPHPRVSIFAAPQERAAVMLRAQQDDEFEVLEHRGRWVRLRLEGDSEGWVEAAQVKSNRPPSSVAARRAAPATEDGSSEANKGYTIVRENSSDFSGDWAPLKGKTVLYAWARPVGSRLNVSPAAKLKFVQSLFSSRGREALHNSQSKVDGIVVIFLDQEGGVAAAAFSDVRRWLDGDLSDAAFLKRCSLDPPSQFTAARSSHQ